MIKTINIIGLNIHKKDFEKYIEYNSLKELIKDKFIKYVDSFDNFLRFLVKKLMETKIMEVFT